MQSLRYLAAKKNVQIADTLPEVAELLDKLPTDLHDTIRKHLTCGTQCILWEGEVKQWYKSGELYQIYHCVMDYKLNCMLHGKQTMWYKNGKMIKQCYLRNGNYDSTYKEW